jgi:hypothetical protein
MQPGTLKFDKTIARPDAEIIEQPGQLPASDQPRRHKLTATGMPNQKVAIITGASQGFGAALVDAYRGLIAAMEADSGPVDALGRHCGCRFLTTAMVTGSPNCWDSSKRTMGQLVDTRRAANQHAGERTGRGGAPTPPGERFNLNLSSSGHVG